MPSDVLAGLAAQRIAARRFDAGDLLVEGGAEASTPSFRIRYFMRARLRFFRSP